jgi:hypothetical protein
MTTVVTTDANLRLGQSRPNRNQFDLDSRDPREVLKRYIHHARTVRVDRAGRKALSRSLNLSHDFQLELAILDLVRRKMAVIDGDRLVRTGRGSR